MSGHHNHHHDHHHESQTAMSFEEKLVKLFEHWVKHNNDHAGTYREWAKRAKENDMAQVCALLEDAADITLSLNKKFEEAAAIAENK